MTTTTTTNNIQTRINEFNAGIRERNPAEYEFHQAVQEFTESVMPFMSAHPMPSTLEAMHHFREANILFAPAKAANAGGVAVSGLEQSQNAMRIPWISEDVDHRLQEIMTHIHQQCVEYGKDKDDHIDYVNGANIAGFVKVADAMLAYGIA